jgi:predicted nucleic acid-binding protein
VVPLLHPEGATTRLEGLYAADPVLNVWCLTGVEAWSAVCRLRRQGRLDSPGMRAARKRFDGLAARWVEVDDVRAVRVRARRLLETHPLKAGDALQLGAALVLVSDRPERIAFVTLDDRLGEAAEREGFEVLGVTPA